MRIRWKLVILLVGLALLPLALVSWLGARSTQLLGDELASRARTTLDDAARVQLRQIVDEYAALLRREAEYLEFSLRVQAREVERCLADPATLGARVYYATAIDAGDVSLPGTRPSARHPFPSPRGNRQPRQVSYEHPVTLLCPDINTPAQIQDAARLATLAPVYRFLHATSPSGLILWQHSTLTSGVHSAFPGHGRFPANFDPCRLFQPDARNDVRWSGLHRDPITQLSVLSLSMNVQRSGEPAGVTSIDIGAEDIFRTIRLPPGWARDARIFLVQHDAAGGSEPGRLRTVAWQDPAAESGDWSTPTQDEWLRSESGPVFGQMLDKMSLGQSGVWPLSYDDKPYLWAHARAHSNDIHVVAIVPMNAIVAFSRDAYAQVWARFQDQWRLSSIVAISVTGMVFVLALLAARSITRPIHELSSAARRIAQGDLDARADVRGNDEIGELGRTFNEMIPHLRDGMKLRESLALAQEVQQALLPAHPPRVPGFDIFGISQYCEQTGGDYYDFLDIADVRPGELGVAVGDVTGHGVAAALLMATARALLRGRAGECASLGDLMTDINRHLSHGAPPDRYMTLYYLVIDADSRRVRWASAGHDAAIVYSRASDSFRELRGNGIPLALEPDWDYEEQSGESLQSGELILIGTDGIWETRNPAGQMFGKDSLRELMREKAQSPAEEIVRSLTERLRAFRAPLPQEDDVTLVVIRVL